MADDYYDDYDAEGYGGSRVLWGRIGFFAVVILLVFALGWCTAPGVSEDELVAEQDRTERLQAENEELRQQLEALEAGGAPDDTTETEPGTEPTEEEPDAEATPTPTPDDGEADEEELETQADGTRTYTVQSGDTLRALSERFYGDPDQSDLIADANGIDADNPLQVGQDLEIPPDDDA